MPSPRLAPSAVLIAVLVLLAGADPASAQAANVAGTWNLEVTTDNGTTTPTVTLVQDGDRLTGRYASETLGEADVTGSVDGSEFTFSFSASVQGQPIDVVYELTLGADGKATGTIDLAGGMMSGSVTATRAGE